MNIKLDQGKQQEKMRQEILIKMEIAAVFPLEVMKKKRVMIELMAKGLGDPNNSSYHEHRRKNANTENEGVKFEIENESDAGPLDGEDCDNENQSSNSSGKLYVKENRHGGNESNQDNGWGSGGEYSDGYGLGHGEGDRHSSDGSGNDDRDRTNIVPVDKAMNTLGISAPMEINGQDLVRIWRRRMLDVHPNQIHLHELLQKQATMRLQRLNDAVEEFHRHLSIP